MKYLSIVIGAVISTAVMLKAALVPAASAPTVTGEKALRTSGRLIVIFAMPSKSSNRMSEYSLIGFQAKVIFSSSKKCHAKNRKGRLSSGKK